MTPVDLATRLRSLITVDDDGQTPLAKALSLAKEWDESEHPRDSSGRFGEGNGGQAGKPSATPSFKTWGDVSAWGKKNNISIDTKGLEADSHMTPEAMHQVATRIEAMNEKFPGIKDELKSIVPYPERGAMAAVGYEPDYPKTIGGSQLLLSSKLGDAYANPEEYAKAKESYTSFDNAGNVRRGASISTSPNDTINHEMAHVLQNQLLRSGEIQEPKRSWNTKTNPYVKAASDAGWLARTSKTGQGPNLHLEYGFSISAYASKNPIECHAEAMALLQRPDLIAQMSETQQKDFRVYTEALNERAGQTILKQQADQGDKYQVIEDDFGLDDEFWQKFYGLVDQRANASKSFAKEWDESKHPRGAGGRFGSGDGSGKTDNGPTDSQKVPTVTGPDGVVSINLGAAKDIEAGAKTYSERIGIDRPNVDFGKVFVNTDTAQHIAENYDHLPIDDPAAHAAYGALAKEVEQQYEFMTKELGIKVDVLKSDPYKDVTEMRKDVEENHHIAVLATAETGHHPFLTDQQNDQFRAVHDVFGHAATGRGFDRHGEEAAWVSHSMMFSPLARQAMTTETRGQNSVLTQEQQGFPPQKVAVLATEYTDPSALIEAIKKMLMKLLEMMTSKAIVSDERNCTAGPAQWDYKNKLGRWASSASKSFNPDQPRDSHGRFGSGDGETDYHMSHTAPSTDFGAPGHDLGRLFPKDVYSKDGPRLYSTHYPKADKECFDAIHRMRGNPDAEVTVYRGVPSHVTDINPGDWVTPSRSYAEIHVESNVPGGHVISRTVRAGDIYNDADSIAEWGWQPSVKKTTTGGVAKEWDESKHPRGAWRIMTTTLLPVSSRDEPLSDEQLRKLRIMAVGTKKSLTEMMYEAARAELQKEIAAVENAIATEFLKDCTKFDEERDAERDQRNGVEGKGATIRDYPGQVGNASHTTRTVSGGTIPTSVLANMEGKSDEGIGTHRNYQGKDWENFKQDIKENGIKSPIYLNVDHNGKPSIAEGNHRRDAAVELGMKDVPVEISYYGHAERQGTVLERAQAQKMAKEWDPEAHPRGPDGRFGDGGGSQVHRALAIDAKGLSDDALRKFASTEHVNGVTHSRGDRLYTATYQGGKQMAFRCATAKEADAVSREYGKRFLNDKTTKDGVRQAPPGTDTTGMTDDTPIGRPTGETTKPEPQGQPTTGPTLDPEVMGRLQGAYGKAQRQYDKAFKGNNEIEMLATTRQYGKQVANAVQDKFDSLKFPDVRPYGEIRKEFKDAQDKINERASGENMNNRFVAMTQELEQQRANALAPVIERALREAGVPETSDAYLHASDPAYIPALFGGKTFGDPGPGYREPIDSEGRVKLGDRFEQTITYRSDDVHQLNGEGALKPTAEEEVSMKPLGIGFVQGNLRTDSAQFTVLAALGGNLVTEEKRYMDYPGTMIYGATAESIRNAVGAQAFDSFKATNDELVASAKTVNENYKAAENEIKNNATQKEEAYNQLMFNTIGSLRELSPPGLLQTRSISPGSGEGVSGKQAKEEQMQKTIAAISEAQSRLPKDWVDAVNKQYGGNLDFKFADRRGNGSFRETREWIGAGRGREKGARIYVATTVSGRNKRELASTTIHEITHGVQGSLTDLHIVERAFFDNRTTGRMVSVGGSGRGDPDNFMRKYTGRNDYGYKFSEIATTGMEAMITPVIEGQDKKYNSFGNDTDFKNFMVGTLLLAGQAKNQ